MSEEAGRILLLEKRASTKRCGPRPVGNSRAGFLRFGSGEKKIKSINSNSSDQSEINKIQMVARELPLSMTSSLIEVSPDDRSDKPLNRKILRSPYSTVTE